MVHFQLSIFNFQLSIVFALALFAIAPQAAQGQTITFNPNLNNNGYTVIEGHNITLTVNAGPGVTYQWYIENKSGDIEVVNGGGYSGGGGGGGVRGY